FASQNISIYGDKELIFTGSLSRNSDMSLSLSNKEARKMLKVIDNIKDIYGKLR
ncbi:hypothetical protein LCGC14_1539770, partial [marine sediment metagenome]